MQNLRPYCRTTEAVSAFCQDLRQYVYIFKYDSTLKAEGLGDEISLSDQLGNQTSVIRSLEGKTKEFNGGPGD